METPKQVFIAGDEDVTGKKEEEEENVGTVPSPPRSSRMFLDTQYGIRKGGEQLMIGDSPVFIDPDDNVTV